MNLHTCATRALTADSVATALGRQQCVILTDAVNADTAETAFTTFKELMQDDAQLRGYPFDPSTRLGYTPPGVETIQRNSEKPDWNRKMFDFNPGLSLGEPSIAALFQEAAEACDIVLRKVDEAYATCLADMPKGGHTLRTAQYLLNGTNPQQVLFGRHRDFSLLTVFIGSGTGGLEVQVDGEWHAVELGYGEVLIGAGTPMAQFHPELQPLWHRVVGGTDYRLSSFLFFDLRDDIVLPKSGERYGDMLARVLKSIRADAA